jgi:multidrug transporter EmrE-like cation transporter
MLQALFINESKELLMTASVIYLAAAIVVNMCANMIFKYSTVSKSLSTAIMMAGIAVSCLTAVFYTKALARIDLSIAFSVFSAGSIIAITILSILLFRETLNLKQTAGLFNMILGIILVAMK